MRPGQLAALAGLRALGDLDLELVGAGEVGGGHPEPCRGDLLDPRVVTTAVGARLVPGRILATLTGVRRAAGALDADRQRLMRLRAQRPDAHRRHDEAADDGPGVLDLVEWHGRPRAPDAQLITRHGPVARRSRQGGPVAGQGGVDVERRAVGVGGRQDLDLAGDPRREQVGFAIGPEPREAWVGQARLATGARARGWPGAAARRRIWRAPRSASVVRPGQAAAFGKQRATTDRSRSTTSMSDPPMYEATALIPIRASVLRRPASNAAASPATASDGLTVSAPRVPASSAASSRASRGWTAVAPTARAMAMAWTSRMSTALTARSVRPRRPAAVSAVWTAPVARIDGIGRRSSDQAASVRTRSWAPRRDAVTASAASRSSARGKTVRARLRIPGRIERAHGRPAAAGSHRVEQPVEVDHDRPGQADRPWAARWTAEERRSPAELDPKVHHDPFAFGIDGRVRHLGERLAEMVGDRPVEPAATGRRRVVAHAPQRLVAFERHRLDVEPGTLGVKAGEIAQDMVGRGAGGNGRRLDAILVGRSRGVMDRQIAQDPGLRLGVLHDRSSAWLDEEQLARPEPAAPDRLRGAERDRPGLRGDGHQPVTRHREGRRPKPVAIDQRTDPPSVGEDDRGRTVPRGKEAGRPASERGDLGMRRSAQGERLGDGRQQGRGQAPSRSSSGARGPRRATTSRTHRPTAAGRPRGAPGRSRSSRRRRPGRRPGRGCHGPC